MAYILACVADTLNHLLIATPIFMVRGAVAMQASPNITRPYQFH